MKKLFVRGTVLVSLLYPHADVMSATKSVAPQDRALSSNLYYASKKSSPQKVLSDVRRASLELEEAGNDFIKTWQQFLKESSSAPGQLKAKAGLSELEKKSDAMLPLFTNLSTAFRNVGLVYIQKIADNAKEKQELITAFKQLQSTLDTIFADGIVKGMKSKLSDDSFVKAQKKLNQYIPLEVVHKLIDSVQMRHRRILSRLRAYVESHDVSLMKEDIAEVEHKIELLHDFIKKAKTADVVSPNMYQEAKEINKSFTHLLSLVPTYLSYVQDPSLREEWEMVSQRFKNTLRQKGKIKADILAIPGRQGVSLIVADTIQNVNSMLSKIMQTE